MASTDSNRRSSSPRRVDTSGDQSPETSAPAKRTRVLLSCHPCRASKLKCNRLTPCGQCLKRGKVDACVYAPRVEKTKPARTMAARLKRLEGMVRGMVEADGGVAGDDKTQGEPTQSEQGGSVVYNERGTNYVGGTHFMAILEDLEDLKTYFEDPEDSDLDEEDPYESVGPSELLMLSRGAPRNKEDLIALLPSKGVMDRLMNRYFNANSPCQHRYAADIHWIAILFMILALGIYFSSFHSPQELELDSSMPAMDRFRQYRGACGCALMYGKYSHPGPFTLQAMCLYLEGDFLANRVSQVNCYLLCSTIMRLMMKMGLHRDPDKLPRISPFEGEMRRRMWNFAVQIDLMVSFHLGLPCMIHGIESDTALPRNLLDSDFDEDSTELPPSRPNNDYTPISYPISKSKVARGFGLVARLSHSLTLPTYAEIMRVDARVQDAWSSVPSFFRVKPLSESVTDPPMIVIQRFGLASLYQKGRCVLHRRYLVDPRRLKEHDYSRRTCLEAAVALLSYQSILADATKPGALLAANRWFIASLAINDFLLADMVVALAVQQENENEDGTDWMATCTPPLDKDSLIQMLERSFTVWEELAVTVADCRKAVSVVRTMLEKIYAQQRRNSDFPSESIPTGSTSSYDEQTSSMADMSLGSTWTNHSSDGYGGIDHSNGMKPSASDVENFGMMDPNLVPAGGHDDSGDAQSHMSTTDPWGVPQMQSGYDWNQFDALTRGPTDHIAQVPQLSQMPPTPHNWIDQNTYNDFGDFLATNSWNSTFPGM
ncbi:hypothetical protein F5B22DRAFT_633462 [Xylaria bambusicola]|uniref:uncharacterized protein n=1 Tax=Xylaria bambusicola TaxID=326684 RepID=UPI00200732DC|nr:uncharacterized protein F5B22DRAFT_633462 [Xylaria bambusicola]KAI0525321.1 hypothetical protein F5B22DRAFT_633462 [Xylaria bambusicola]